MRHEKDFTKYHGTDIPVTAPLFTLECENGHRDWYLAPRERCMKCNGLIIKGNPSSYKGVAGT